EEKPAPSATTEGTVPLPNYAFPENAARVLGKLARYAEWRDQPAGIVPEFDDIQPQDARAICQRARREHGASWLSVEETRTVLAAFAVPLAPGGICRDAQAAASM